MASCGLYVSEAYCLGVSKRVGELIAIIMMRMIWGPQMLLLTIAVVTAFVEPNNMEKYLQLPKVILGREAQGHTHRRTSPNDSSCR